MGTATGRLLAAIVAVATLSVSSCSLDSDWRRPSPIVFMNSGWIEPDDRTNLGFEPTLDDDAMQIVQEVADAYDLVVLVPSRTLGVDMPRWYEGEAFYEVHLLKWAGSETSEPSLRVAYAGTVFTKYEENGNVWHYPELWHWRSNDSLRPSRRDLSEECLAGEQLVIRGNGGCRFRNESADTRAAYRYWVYEWLEDGQHHLLHLSWASAEAFSLNEVLAWLDSLVAVPPSG